jgi:AraC family ethanolamine operon transcriptional activator
MIEYPAPDREGAQPSGAFGVGIECTVSTDPEEASARRRASGMNVHHDQLSPGPYSAAIRSIFLPGLKFARTSYGPAIASHGHPFEGTYALVLPLSGVEGAYFDGQPLHENEVGVVRPGRQFHLLRPPGFECVTFFPDAALIDRHSEAMRGVPFAKLCRGASTLTAGDGEVKACAQHLAQVCNVAASDAGPLRNWVASCGGSEQLVGELIDEVLGIVQPPEPALSWSARGRVVKRACKIVRDNEGAATVSELCATLGVPIRTLDEAFHTCMGMPPKRFILGVRLNKVRRGLCRPGDTTTVTDLATRFGFFHFGHFSTQYAKLFGELPSQTLRRARA